MKARIIKTIHIEAARRIPCDSPEDPVQYSGNQYSIDLIAEGEVLPDIGWVVDYAELKQLFEPLRLMLDHHCLNDIPELAADESPEAIECWINKRLEPWPCWFAGVRVSQMIPREFMPVELPPSPLHDLPARLAFSFSAAQSLPQLPEGHPCRNLHGHTYQVEIAVQGDMDIIPVAQSLFEALDNQYLNTIQGLEQATSERIAAWTWRFLESKNVLPTFVAIQETPANRCHYYGE